MSPEIINVVTNHLPEIAFAMGYVGGQGANNRAIETAFASKQAINRHLGALAGENAESDSNIEVSRFQRIAEKAGRYTSTLALVASSAAGVSVVAWSPYNTHQQASALEIVVDHSGATALPIEGNPPYSRINAIVDKFSGNHNLVVTEQIGSSSHFVETKKVTKVDAASAAEDVAMGDGVQIALNETATLKANLSVNEANNSSGILVITNGNVITKGQNFGNATQLIGQAKQAGNTPIFIVNVEATNYTNPATIKDFEAIATQTGGHYWDANDANINAIANSVSKTISPHEAKQPDFPNHNFLKFMSGVLVVATALKYKFRTQEPINRDK